MPNTPQWAACFRYFITNISRFGARDKELPLQRAELYR